MVIKVPDVQGPRAQLCWKESETLVRCDRKKGHQERCSWDLVAEIDRLEKIIGAVRRALPRSLQDIDNDALRGTGG